PRAHYTVADGMAANDVWRLHEDTHGDLWIASRIPGAEPLTRWRRRSGEFQRFGPQDGLPAQQAIHGFAEDRAGGLWVNSSQVGLSRFDGTRFHLLAPRRGLPPGTVGSSIHVDRRGRLWATVGGVLIRIPDPTSAEPRVSPYPAPHTWFDSAGGVLAEDDAGWIYVRSSRGLARLQPESGAYQELGSGTPFTSIDRAYRDDQGTLWFATSQGVLRYEPQPLRESPPPPVWIRQVRIAGVAQPVPPMGVRRLAPLHMTTDQRQMQIDYFGLGFGPDELLRFQVRLDGADEEWSEATTRRSAAYVGLSPGRYRFRVRAVTTTGQISAEPATVAFTIPPPLWQRAWFLGLVAVTLGALLVAAHRLRVRRLLELERVRTRIATDLHDDLGASLARVSVLTELARRTLRHDPDDSERVLEEIGETSRRLVEAAADIAYAVDPERVALSAFVARLRRFADDLLAGTDIAWRFQALGETSSVVLTPEQRRHLLAILKEGLHNAVKHAAAQHISLTLEASEGTLSAELIDDGCGFEHDRYASGEWAPPGRGLRNMRHRARELGGQLTIDATPGRGTRVRLTVPRH
ncbi:MAG: ATP-binding protein, partial [Thermoanaerobaculia bacterium]